MSDLENDLEHELNCERQAQEYIQFLGLQTTRYERRLKIIEINIETLKNKIKVKNGKNL